MWIEDEEVRERVYEAASARLAERAGRTGKLVDFLGYSSFLAPSLHCDAQLKKLNSGSLSSSHTDKSLESFSSSEIYHRSCESTKSPYLLSFSTLNSYWPSESPLLSRAGVSDPIAYQIMFHTDSFFIAQPTLTRTFTIPGHLPNAPHIHIRLREPSLTSDNLGHKTWLASYLLARRLPSLRHFLPSILRPSSTDSPRILELGSGTGLLGIAAAALFPDASVHLTDLEAIVSNLQANVKANEVLFPKGKSPSVGALDWSAPSTASPDRRFDLILASDPLYSPLHPTWLVNTIIKYLNGYTTSRVMIELPLREAYVPEVEEFKMRIADGGLVLLHSGEEVGTEDWGDDAGHGRDDVRCWWGVWGWPWL